MFLTWGVVNETLDPDTPPLLPGLKYLSFAQSILQLVAKHVIAKSCKGKCSITFKKNEKYLRSLDDDPLLRLNDPSLWASKSPLT